MKKQEVAVILLLALTGLAQAPRNNPPPPATYFKVVQQYTPSVLHPFPTQWTLLDQHGKPFVYLGVYDVSPEFISSQIMQSRYGGDSTKWATHSLDRMQAAGFNAIDIYASDYVLPVKTQASKGATPQLPFMLYWPALNEVVSSPGHLGLPEAIKDVECSGQHQYGYGSAKGYCGYTLDVFDPKWQQANTAELPIQVGRIGGGFATQQLVIGVSLGDATNVNSLAGNGSGANGVPQYPHTGQLVATGNFQQSGFKDPKVYSKYAWVAFIKSRYASIADLNGAWGTGGFYTSFDDPSQTFGTGKSVLAEDGRHKWFGAGDFFNQSGMDSVLKADLDDFLYQFALQAYAVQAKTVRSYDKNHLFACGSFGGSGNGGTRPQVLHALHDAGCNIVVLNWNSRFAVASLATDQQEAKTFGGGVMVWYGTTACPDSPYCPGDQWSNQPTQLARGQEYARDVAAIFKAKFLGIVLWGLTDKPSEKDNWGLISAPLDNLYDGKCAVRAASKDQWGFPCGGEAVDYGDFFHGIAQANAAAKGN